MVQSNKYWILSFFPLVLVLFVYEVCLSCSILIWLSGFKVFRSFLVCISFLDIEIEVSSLVFLLHFKLALLGLIKEIKSLVLVLYQFSLFSFFLVCVLHVRFYPQLGFVGFCWVSVQFWYILAFLTLNWSIKLSLFRSFSACLGGFNYDLNVLFWFFQLLVGVNFYAGQYWSSLIHVNF